MIYHGDCNADGVFDFADVDPFIERLGNTRLTGDDDFQLAYTAEELAAGIRAHVSEDQLALVQSLAATMADYSAVRPAYWQAAYELLSQ